jgi:Protein of unknown function (DUF2933)
MQGHNHGARGHLLGMVGIGAVILIGVMATGRSFSQALPLAASLACPIMMIGMMFMMGKGHQQEEAHGDVDARDTHADEVGHVHH